ncbi:MAG: DUF2934 domain-containing protein [Steroidobacteraceae bacterium]
MTNPEPDKVRDLAYQLWQRRGQTGGSPESDWLDAEETLRKAALQTVADETAKESFPASDPPASHLPDVPPVNADAKWAAARRATGKSGLPPPAATRQR